MPNEPSKDLISDLEHLLIGVDTLMGGNIKSEREIDHAIADSWFNGRPIPSLYNDQDAIKLREAGGIKAGNDYPYANSFVANQKLRDYPDAIRAQVERLEDELPDRKIYLTNMVNMLEVALNTLIAIANKTELPSYDARYCVTARIAEAELAPTEHARENLRKALSEAGYHSDTNDGSILRGKLHEWLADKGYVKPGLVGPRSKEIAANLLTATREKILRPLRIEIPGHQQAFEDIPFDQYDFRLVQNAHFTAGSSYRGGTTGFGEAALRGRIQYNTDHPLTDEQLMHLFSHEILPGHWFNSAITDLLISANRLFPEAGIGTMLSPQVAFEEGWAENVLYLLGNSHEEIGERLKVSSKDLAVVMALEELQSIGKHNASILYQKQGVDLDAVKRHIAYQCVQPTSKVSKLSGKWAVDPLIGPMYGPAYHIGSQVVRDAIMQYGPEKVTRVGLQLDGKVDIETFQLKVAR